MKNIFKILSNTVVAIVKAVMELPISIIKNYNEGFIDIQKQNLIDHYNEMEALEILEIKTNKKFESYSVRVSNDPELEGFEFFAAV